MVETLKSTDILVKEGFDVMVYCSDDPIIAKKLERSWGSCNYAACLSNWFWKRY